MTNKLRSLFSLQGRVPRAHYFLAGSLLLVLKFLIDHTIAARFGHTWHIWSYFFPPADLSIFGLGSSNPRFYLILWAVAIPFFWIGIALTLQRLRDAGMRLGLVFLFFVPIAKLFFFLASLSLGPIGTVREFALAIGPHSSPLRSSSCRRSTRSRRRRHDRLFRRKRARQIRLRSLPRGSVFHRIHSFLGAQRQRDPLQRQHHCDQCCDACFHRACTHRLSCGGSRFASSWRFRSPFRSPSLADLQRAIASVADELRGTGTESVTACLRYSSSAPCSYEQSANLQPPVRAVTTSIVVNAPASVVWKNVIVFPPLAAPTELLFRSGIAYPIGAQIIGSGPGAVRYCRFSTGDFVEPITVWNENHLLAFDVASEPPSLNELGIGPIHTPHIDRNYMRSLHGQFRLVALDDRRTLVEGTTWYQDFFWPQSYWGAWSGRHRPSHPHPRSAARQSAGRISGPPTLTSRKAEVLDTTL